MNPDRIREFRKGRGQKSPKLRGKLGLGTVDFPSDRRHADEDRRETTRRMETVETVPSNTKEGKGGGLACVPTHPSDHRRREKRSGTKDESQGGTQQVFIKCTFSLRAIKRIASL